VEGAGFGCLQCSEGNVAVGFNGPRNYSGTVTSGFILMYLHLKLLILFEVGDRRKDVAILDMKDWGLKLVATYGKFMNTGLF
jgi:hypothetical protein